MRSSTRVARISSAFGVLAFASLACGLANAAEIVLEASAVDKLVKQSVFNDEGRHYFTKGTCFAYLEQPTTTLKDGRIWIRAHLNSKLGIDNGTDCIGASYATWIVSSGKPVASGSSIGLEDIRVDSVEDETARTVIESGLLPTLPKAVNLDLKKAIEQGLQDSVQGIQSTVDSFAVRSVSVVEDKRLSAVFDFKVTAR